MNRNEKNVNKLTMLGMMTALVFVSNYLRITMPIAIGGGTYAKSMPNLVAFGPIFPGDEVREHKPDEYMEIERVLQNAEIIAAAMYELAK